MKARFRLAIFVIGLLALLTIRWTPPRKSADLPPHVAAAAATLRQQEKPVPIAPSAKLIASEPFSPSSTLRPVGSWKYVGNATPKAAFESLLWAKEHLESAVLASLLSISPELRVKADEVFFVYDRRHDRRSADDRTRKLPVQRSDIATVKKSTRASEKSFGAFLGFERAYGRWTGFIFEVQP
jgi:hypothetical protein